jgi:hypothetical protein
MEMRLKNRLLFAAICGLILFLVGFAEHIAGWRRIAIAKAQDPKSGSTEKVLQTSTIDAKNSTGVAGATQYESVRSTHLLSDGNGWVIAGSQLMWTTTSGREWNDISPPVEKGRVLAASFVSPSTGWSVLEVFDAGTDRNSLVLGSTSDGGRSWSLIQLLSPSDYRDYEPSDQISIQFVDSHHGWVMVKLTSSSNFSNGLLFESSDGGSTWQKLPDPPIGDSIRFVTNELGWLAGGPGGDRLYNTRDSGRTWSRVSVEALNRGYEDLEPTFDLPVFQNKVEGVLPVTFSGPDKTILVFYQTVDGGKTWSVKQTVPLPYRTAVGNRIPSSIISPDSFVVASPSPIRLTRMTNGTPLTGGVGLSGFGPSASVLGIDFTNSIVGWLLVNEGQCLGFKTQCSQVTKLFSTNDGGNTLTEITPHVVLPQPTSKVLKPENDGSVPQGTSGTHTSKNLKGFDKCAADTASTMQTWWSSSPYYDSNIYIGGANRSCTQSNLNSSWVNQVVAMGWGLIPTWVGPQATCTTCATCSVMSSNSSTAQSQGTNEANSASDAASALGLTQTIIYYDMERYNPNATCQTAVRSFINGWVQQIHARGNLAGVYGSPGNAQDDWASIANPPDAVWIAKWDDSVSVFGLTPLSDSLWTSDQRIHQYHGGHNETYGGITFNIDNDYEDGPVAGSASSQNLPNLTPYQPSGWSDKIVVSKVTGTSTDSGSYSTTDTLYIDWSEINSGSAATVPTFYSDLYVDGVFRQTWQTNFSLGVGSSAFVQDYSIGSLSAGQHTIRIVIDSTNTITENNESDNEYTKTITVTNSSLPNVVPYQPSGWSDKIVVSTGTGTSTDSGSYSTTDTLYVDWAEANIGLAATGPTFSSDLYVDGVFRQSWQTNFSLGVGASAFVQDYSIGSLSAGPHTIKIVIDSTNTITESNESDNEYTKTIIVGSTATGTWTQLSATPPAAINNCLLLTDGRVICQRAFTNQWYALTPNSSGSYINGTWSALASMRAGYNPLYFASAVLSDGRVIVEGGEYNCDGSGLCDPNHSQQNWQAQGAIYNPILNSWTAVSPPSTWTSIGDAAGIVLADGTFFLSDALSQKTAKFNANSLTWIAFGSGFQAPTNDESGWTLLPDNSLLTVDASPANSLLSERFNPTTGVWSSAGNTPVSLADNDSARSSASHEIGPGVLRPNGTVFFVGANPNIGTPCCVGAAHTAIFNTATSTWSAGPNIPNSDAANDAPAAVLPNGNVLMQLAPPASSTDVFGSPSRFYEFNGSSIFQVNSPPVTNYPSFQGGMLILPTGQVLFTHQSTDAYIYTPVGAPNAAWAPTITNVPSTLSPGATYTISGTQFNGLTQGAYYGDDLQAATNYPIVRITNNSTSHVFYARTHDHSSMGVATGGITVSTSFDVPTGIELGSSTLTVVANGIPSSAVNVNITTGSVQVTVQTNPAGRTFTVDGTTYSAAQTLSWTPGSSHTISTTSQQSGATGTQYVWSSWSDGGAIGHTIAPGSNTTYTANFTTQYLLTTSAGAGGTASPPSGFFNSGQGVQVSATANNGFAFTGWTGSGAGSFTGSSNPVTVTMSGPITETASFTQNALQITVQANPSGRSFAVDGVTYTSTQTFPWTSGSSHTISTSSPQSGGTGTQYVWSGWSDGGAIAHSVSPTSNTTYTANFATQYLLTMNAGAGGTASPPSGYFNSGQSVSISASPLSGYSFNSWSGVGSGSFGGTSNPASVTMNGPIIETANFNPLSPPPSGLNVALAANGGVASASSTLDSGRAPSAANNGDRKGIHWGSDPSTGSGWHDATSSAFPDWLQIDFSGAKTIDEIDVFSVQDDYSNPVDPNDTTTFTLYGTTAFDVQYWNGVSWVTVPGGSVSGNNLVKRTFTFSPITTAAIRVLVNNSLAGYSRITEVEAWAPINVALASNGGVASASSTLDSGRAPSAANNGDRKGVHWGTDPTTGSGWHDATSNAFPDWLQIDFSGSKTIHEIDVFSVQDNYSNPVDPNDTTTFTLYGMTAFDVQYWDGASWVTVPGGSVSGNNLVKRTFTFSPITTTAIRVLVNNSLAGYSRITEVEAWGTGSVTPPPVNVALASNGGAATASSSLDPGRLPNAANNGDRKGIHWGTDPTTGSGWHDATSNSYPDFLQIDFSGSKTIGEIDVFSVQDNYSNPSDPTDTLAFSLYGITAFDVQYWNGSSWVTVPGGSVTGNNLVKRKFTFSPISTTKIRVLVNDSLNGYSRIVEVEAYQVP